MSDAEITALDIVTLVIAVVGVVLAAASAARVAATVRGEMLAFAQRPCESRSAWPAPG
jgi:hypothetical protein